MNGSGQRWMHVFELSLRGADGRERRILVLAVDEAEARSIAGTDQRQVSAIASRGRFFVRSGGRIIGAAAPPDDP